MRNHLILLAVSFLSPNAGAQITTGRSAPAPSFTVPAVVTPLRTYFVGTNAQLGASLKTLDLPQSAIPQLKAAGAYLLNQGPIAMLAIPEAKQVALIPKAWTARGASVEWKETKPRTTWDRGSAVQDRVSQTLETMIEHTAAKDAWASRVLIQDLFDGRGKHPDNEVVYHGRTNVPGAVVLETQESRGPIRSELRSWNTKTGELLLAALPRSIHHYTVHPKPLKNGQVLVQLSDYHDQHPRFALFSPKTGKLEMFWPAKTDRGLGDSLLHPDQKRVVFLGNYMTDAPVIVLQNFRTGDRDRITADRAMKEPILLKISPDGRYAYLAEGANRRWRMDLTSGETARN